MVDGSVKIGVGLDTKNFDKQIMKLEQEMNEIQKVLSWKKAPEIFSEEYLKKQEIKLEQLGNKLVDLKNRQRSYNDEVKKTPDAIEKINSTMSKIGKTAKLWIGAIFGVRTAYNAIRRAISLVSSQNDAIKEKIDTMSNALGNLLAPVVERIVNGLFTMMKYLDYITQAWFGISLFSKANDKSMKGAVAGAKALRKELMGFDEANVLNDDGGTSGVGSTGVGDFTMEDVKIPEWVKWIADNKDKILEGLKEIAMWIGVVFAVGKILEFTDGIIKITSLFTSMGKVFNITGLEMGLIIGSIIVILGVLIGITKDVIEIQKAKEKANNSLRDAEKNLEQAIKNVKDAEKNLNEVRLESISAIENREEAEKRLKEAQDRTKLSGKELADQVTDGTLKYENMNEKQREVYKAYLDLEVATDKVTETKKKETDATKKLTDAQKWEALRADEAKISQMLKNKEYDKAREAILKLKDDHNISWQNMNAKLKEVMKDMSVEEKKHFIEDLPENIKKGLEPSKFSQAMSKLGSWFKDQFAKISGNAKIETSVSGKSSTGSVMKSATGSVIKMAGGGIINLPNQGVPLRTGVIGGESGAEGVIPLTNSAEGVIPLTNSQMMSELGQAIGRWITLDFTNVTELNGKVISREIAKIQNTENFIMNR